MGDLKFSENILLAVVWVLVVDSFYLICISV